MSQTAQSGNSPGQNAASSSGEDARPAEAAYLKDLGDRVRRIRAIRGMSRKTLAQVSGISERYIAQLEGGAGNVSIMLLLRIARATGVRIEDIVADAPDDWAAMRELIARASPSRIAQARLILAGQNIGPVEPETLFTEPRIALIGLRGAGKSTLGQRAAQELGVKFLELNREIEHEHGLSVTEIFKLYGQDGYRRLELASLRRIAAEPGPVLLATGGGIVAEPLAFDLLLGSFFTVWVRAQPQEHMSRVRKQGDLRPMANDRAAMEELVTILTNREPLYARAHAQVDTSAKSEARSLEDMLTAITSRYPELNRAAAPN